MIERIAVSNSQRPGRARKHLARKLFGGYASSWDTPALRRRQSRAAKTCLTCLGARVKLLPTLGAGRSTLDLLQPEIPIWRSIAKTNTQSWVQNHSVRGGE
jgi:hypothetical protein